MHAPASPFEGLAEDELVEGEPTGQLWGSTDQRGVDLATIKKWSVDPQVKGKSLF